MNIKKGLMAGLAALTLSISANASFINVGGVVWDPDSINAFPLENDFTSSGTIKESATNGVIGDVVTGYGLMTNINNLFPFNFCPGCELTMTFSMKLSSLTPTGLNSADFSFSNLIINFFVDNNPATIYNDTLANASDGVLWLQLATNSLLSGSGDFIGTGSDTGTGSGLLDVTGGIAMGNFDTNTKTNGSDFVFTSSFQPVLNNGIPTGMLSGDYQLTGNSIPEPSSIALLGLALVGFGAASRKKSFK